jgi:hypothetical protein
MHSYPLVTIGRIGAGHIAAAEMHETFDPFGLTAGARRNMGQLSWSDVLDPYALGRSAADYLVGTQAAVPRPSLTPDSDSATNLAPSKEGIPGKVNVTDWLWMHSEANLSSSRVGKAMSGEIVTVTGQSLNGFRYIINASGVRGWVKEMAPDGSKKYLISPDQPISPAPSGPQAVIEPSAKEKTGGLSMASKVLLGVGGTIAVLGGLYYAFSD